MVGEAGEVGRYVPKYVNNRQVNMGIRGYGVWVVRGILTKTKRS